MYVSEVMTKGVECVGLDTSIQDAAEVMKTHDVGALPVCHADRLIGMLTDRDITVRSVSFGHDCRIERVRDAMTPEIVYCFDDQEVEAAARIMEEHQIRRLPVLNRARRLVGIVSLGDLALETGDARLVGSALEQISEPSAPQR